MSRVFVQYKMSGWYKIHDAQEFVAFHHEHQCWCSTNPSEPCIYPFFVRLEQDGDDPCLDFLMESDLTGLLALLHSSI